MTPRPTAAPGPGILDGLLRLARLDLLADDQRRLAAEAAHKFGGEVVYVAVIGEFKRGKSSLINALLGEDLLPAGVTPVTAVPTLVRFGETRCATVRLRDGGEQAIPPADLAAYITERANPHNRRSVREVVVETPSPLLRSGMVLADTPGTGSIHTHNTAAAESFLPRVDIALLVLTVEAPLSAAEAGMLAATLATAARCAICLNKVDLLGPAERGEALDYVRSQVGALSGERPVPIFPVSARGSGERGGGGGGIEAVRRFLSRVSGDERRAVVEARAHTIASSLVLVAEAALRLGLAAAAQPVETARAARAAFAVACSDLEREAAESLTLLLAACRLAEPEVVEARAADLRRSLPPELLSAPAEEWPERSRRAAGLWITAVQAELSRRCEVAQARHAERLQERLGSFVRRVGDAYGVSLPAPGDLRRDLRIPEIRIEIADEPGALAMGVRQVRRHLPGPLGRSWRERARREAAAEAADRLAGRLRHAALQAADRAARGGARDLESGWRSLSEALAAAVDRAERAAADSGRAHAGLDEAARELDAIRAAVTGPGAAPPAAAQLPGADAG